MGVSDAAARAPQEVYRPAFGAHVGATETTQAERKATRQAKKAAYQSKQQRLVDESHTVERLHPLRPDEQLRANAARLEARKPVKLTGMGGRQLSTGIAAKPTYGQLLSSVCMLQSFRWWLQASRFYFARYDPVPKASHVFHVIVTSLFCCPSNPTANSNRMPCFASCRMNSRSAQRARLIPMRLTRSVQQMLSNALQHSNYSFRQNARVDQILLVKKTSACASVCERYNLSHVDGVPKIAFAGVDGATDPTCIALIDCSNTCVHHHTLF